MAFSFLFRSSLAKAKTLIKPAFMDCRMNFRLNPSLLASSGSLHNNNSHHLSSSTLFRFFSAQTTPMERGSELVSKETTFGDGEGRKSDQSNKGGVHFRTFRMDHLIHALLVFIPLGLIPIPAYNKGVEEKNKSRFEEFKLMLLEPGFVSKIVVNHSLALVYLKNNTKFRSVFDRDQPIEKGEYLLGINSPESFKVGLEQTQKILGLESVPVTDLTKNYPKNPRKHRQEPKLF